METEMISSMCCHSTTFPRRRGCRCASSLPSSPPSWRPPYCWVAVQSGWVRGARWQLWPVCVGPPACMVSTRWVGGSAGREWERWERGRWNTEGSSPATQSVRKVERDREGGDQWDPQGPWKVEQSEQGGAGGTGIWNEWGGYIAGSGRKVADPENGEVRDVSGNRERGDKQRELEEGWQVGMEGGEVRFRGEIMIAGGRQEEGGNIFLTLKIVGKCI